MGTTTAQFSSFRLRFKKTNSTCIGQTDAFRKNKSRDSRLSKAIGGFTLDAEDNNNKKKEKKSNKFWR